MPDDVKNPLGYPKRGSFGDLLEWHIKWGTYPKCRRDKKGKKWPIGEFSNQIRIGNEDVDSTVRKLYNWRKNIDLPDDDEEVKSICLLLFNGETHFEDWEEDLWAALARDRQQKGRTGGGIILHSLPFAHHQFHKLKTEPSNLIELLRTDVRATSLVGRETELAMLGAWLATPQSIAVKCIIGGAGAGKTRLAIEACDQAEADGWFATFLSSSELQPPHDMQALADWAPPQPTLLVVDYAATSVSAIKHWLAALALQRDRSGHKLRILLLERHADRESGWWADLLRPDSHTHASYADVIGGEIPYALPPLDAIRDRRALLKEVMTKAAPLFNTTRSPMELPESGENLWFDQRLARNTFDTEPLYLIMAGIRAVETGAPTALAMNKFNLAKWMADIEVDRLRKFAAARGFADGGDLLHHVVACVTLQNGCEPSRLTDLIKDERQALHITAPFGDRRIAEIICDFLPVSGKVQPVRPDFIGEVFSLSAIDGGRFRDAPLRREIVLRCWQREPTGTGDTLIRCACDFVEGWAVQSPTQYLLDIGQNANNFECLLSLNEKIGAFTSYLGEASLNICKIVVKYLRILTDRNADIFELDLAIVLGDLSSRLSYFGKFEEALQCSEESLSHFRELAIRWDLTECFLASALLNFADRLRKMDRGEEALATIGEAQTTYLRAFADSPDVLAEALASTHQASAACLVDLGRYESALEARERALSICRQLNREKSGVYMPKLAMMLYDVAVNQIYLGRYDEAIANIRQSLAIYEQLAILDPNKFSTYASRCLAMIGEIGKDNPNI